MAGFLTDSYVQCLTNIKELSHWTLIQKTVYHGWGAKNIVVNASVLWGTVMSNSSFCDQDYTKLCKNICSFQHALLRKTRAGIFIFDHVQGKELLCDQRGNSSKFLKGTHRITNKVFNYKIKYNQIQVQVDNTYNEEQLSMSSDGIREYESIPIDAPDFGTQVYCSSFTAEYT